ncbi:hypothetical protein [Streptomyces sp. NBC_01614]|uniref:hypothetical protein n=1 Tax=Streptomyces sp. NBC_01614 TaxID=2975897 RepID=UPI00386C0C64
MSSDQLPTAAGCSLHYAGEDWDVIRVPHSVGLGAMAILGARGGAIVEDPLSAIVYYFVPRGTSSDWDVVDTRALGTGASVAIPPARCTRGASPRWRVCPGDDGWLTDPDALRAAIEDARGHQSESEESA